MKHKPKIGTWLMNIGSRVLAYILIFTAPYEYLSWVACAVYVFMEGVFLNEYSEFLGRKK